MRGTSTMQASETNGTDSGYAATTTPIWKVSRLNCSA
jgi:hypothetical protein